MPEILNPRNPPDNHLESISGLRGAICGFIFNSDRKAVTHAEIVAKFSDYEEAWGEPGRLFVEEAITGLLDRQYLDYADGNYFQNPDFPRKQPLAVKKRLYGKRLDGRRNYAKSANANDLDYPVRLFHSFHKASLNPAIPEVERAAARDRMWDVWAILPAALAANILDMKGQNLGE